jgi:hypothetical protein
LVHYGIELPLTRALGQGYKRIAGLRAPSSRAIAAPASI